MVVSTLVVSLIGSLLCNRNSRIPSHSPRPSSCRRCRRQSSLRRRTTGVSRSSTWPRCSWMRCSSSWRSRPFAGSPSLGLQISWFCFARSFANFALIVTVTYAYTLRCRSPRWLPSWRCPRMNSARTCSASSTRWRTSYGWRALRVWMESYSRFYAWIIIGWPCRFFYRWISTSTVAWSTSPTPRWRDATAITSSDRSTSLRRSTAAWRLWSSDSGATSAHAKTNVTMCVPPVSVETINEDTKQKKTFAINSILGHKLETGQRFKQRQVLLYMYKTL